jgi:hypothetical protein
MPTWPPVVALIEWKLPGDGGASQQSHARILQHPSARPLHDPLVKHLIVSNEFSTGSSGSSGSKAQAKSHGYGGWGG